MKRYKTRPGIVLTSIAGQYVLVAVKSLRSICPYSAQVNETTAFCWRMLEEGTDFESLLAGLSEEYEIDDMETARADLTELLEQMISANYLIEEP